MKLRHIALAVSFALVSSQAMANGSIFVTEPGADGFNIETLGFNGSSYLITQITFDFSSTTTSDGSYLVIDGSPISITPPAGGTATFFGSGAVFGFNFTSFDTFDVFKFSWDPDSAIDGSYGATSFDFIGGVVTAWTDNGLVYTGTFAQVGFTPDVAAVLTPVPEPSSYALMLAGIGLLGIAMRRKSQT
ncbi:PEPxxWA-CTERM sorting domain-containing protein [Methylobacillus caricis]|uniref:PEP-CTERM sorting domain-containing protein n=1 Tax=Methylobacillus caricis TaxID=1971611 RepID=UPI001CFF7966|nr:PEP-CTERM sorting domain-containing protein [Methylobacillus caricis]MCB5187364.1 PEPxxWA-CTERM sorting domain-containing protein [Methylobacillus caricis]